MLIPMERQERHRAELPEKTVKLDSVGLAENTKLRVDVSGNKVQNA